jgi:hypothetical protein
MELERDNNIAAFPENASGKHEKGRKKPEKTGKHVRGIRIPGE